MRSLTWGRQFSPTQTPLDKLLPILEEADGSVQALQDRVIAHFFSGRPSSLRLAYNCIHSLETFELITVVDGTYELTPLARELLATGDPESQRRIFGRHLLQRHAGLEALYAVRRLRALELPVTQESIAEELLDYWEIDPGRQSGERLSALKQWLQWCGCINTRWVIDEDRVEEIIGLTTDDLDALQALDKRDRAFLLALATHPLSSVEVLPGEERPWISSSDVRALANQQQGQRLIKGRGLAAQVKRLASDGWVEISGDGKRESFKIRGTVKFREEVGVELLQALATHADLPDPAQLRRPLRELIADVRAGERTGLALEGVGLHVMRLMGARFLHHRGRRPVAADAEVDVVAERTNGRYELLHVQCKTSDIRERHVVDREIGPALTAGVNTIVFISAGSIAESARDAGERYMRRTGLNIVFFDGADLAAMATDGSAATGIIEREFRRVARVKRAAEAAET